MAWSVRLARSQMQRSDGQLSFGAPGATWDYSPAVFLLSLWRLGERTGDPAYGRYARAVIDWIAYGYAQRTEKNPETFGSGDVRGVIAPEASNNAKEGGHLVPTIAFGVPAGASMAILLT